MPASQFFTDRSPAPVHSMTVFTLGEWFPAGLAERGRWRPRKIRDGLYSEELCPLSATSPAMVLAGTSVIPPEAGSVVSPQPDGPSSAESLPGRYMKADVADAAAARTRRIDLHQICYVQHFSRSDRSFSRLAIDICEPGLGRRH
jgi:hypothetical protein